MQCSAYFQLITDKTDAADLSGGLRWFIRSVNCVLPKRNKYKIHHVPQISSKLGNSDVTKEALNCTDSIAAAVTALLTPLFS